ILMHATPVAGALDFPSPVAACHLSFALPFFQVVLPAVLNRAEAAGVCGTLAIETTDGPSFSLSFDDGELVVALSVPPSADCYVKASSSTVVSVSLGLEPESAAIERGDWVISGPSPELGEAFKRLLPNP
ncbi:MAG: SCP2 sterol-binding domain-containing protein, partial [Actinomycetota bacterium]